MPPGDSQDTPPPMHEMRRPPVGLILASMLGVVAWLVFILLFALEWSGKYDFFQDIVVAFVSLAIVGILVGAMWMVWGYRQFGRFGDWWS